MAARLKVAPGGDLSGAGPDADLPRQRGAADAGGGTGKPPITPLRRSRRGGEEPVVRRAVLRLVAACVGSLVVAGAIAAFWADRSAREEVLAGAFETADRFASRAVAPLVTDSLVAGDPIAYEALDRVVRARTSDGSILGVVLWDGRRVVYSDEPGLVGRPFPRDESSPPAPRDGSTRIDGPAVEVHVGVRGGDGESYLLVARLPGRHLQATENRLLRRQLPVVAAAVGVFALLLLPGAVSLARRGARVERSRRRLLQRAMTATETERRRVAQGLHDDVIQDLSGLGYLLSGTVSHLPERTPAELRAVVSTADLLVRRSVTRLRHVLAGVAPPDLEEAGLARLLDELAEPLRVGGVSASVEVGADLVVSPATKALLYRVARELLRNVESHAGAGQVEVAVRRRADSVVLVVADDGVGADSRPAARSSEGHVGLALVRDAIQGVGGELVLDSAPGRGFRAEARVPLS